MNPRGKKRQNLGNFRFRMNAPSSPRPQNEFQHEYTPLSD